MALTLQRAPLVLLPLLVIAGWFFALRPAALGGPVQYVVIEGESMEPTLYSGDLVLIRTDDEYEVGDIISFETPIGTVMHRIVAGNAEAGFVSQGDNNTVTDPWQPTNANIIGKMWVRVPGGAHLQWIAPITLVLSILSLGGATWYVYRRTREPAIPIGPPL